MKKKILVLLLLLFSLSALHSLEGEFSISSGVLGLGFNSDFETFGGYSYGRILNFMYQSSDGLGFVISPLVLFNNDFFNYADNYSPFYSSLTCVNGSIFYNFLKKTSDELILGPSIAVNTVNFENIAFVEFRSGLIFSLRSIYAKNNMYDTDIFSVELGYRYNNIDRHGIYFHIGFDLVAVMWFIGKFYSGYNYQGKKM